jgi:hypothetical protein
MQYCYTQTDPHIMLTGSELLAKVKELGDVLQIRPGAGMRLCEQ